MANNIPPRRVSLGYILGIKKHPFKEPKPTPPPHPPPVRGMDQILRSPGGIVEWAASDGRKGKLTGPGAARQKAAEQKSDDKQDAIAKEDKKKDEKKDEKKDNKDASGDGENDDSDGWTEEQDKALRAYKDEHGNGPWQECIDALNIGKTKEQFTARWKKIKPADWAPPESAGKKDGGGTKKEKNKNKGNNGGSKPDAKPNDSTGDADNFLGGFDVFATTDENNTADNNANNNTGNAWPNNDTFGTTFTEQQNTGAPTWENNTGNDTGAPTWENNTGVDNTGGTPGYTWEANGPSDSGNQNSSADAWPCSGAYNTWPDTSGSGANEPSWNNAPAQTTANNPADTTTNNAWPQQQPPTTTTNNNTNAFPSSTANACAPAAKPPSSSSKHSHKHASKTHPSNHPHPPSTTTTIIHLTPDATFSAADLRLVARILQQDAQMLWQRVSWRFGDKTGRTVGADEFERKIVGRGGSEL